MPGPRARTPWAHRAGTGGVSAWPGRELGTSAGDGRCQCGHQKPRPQATPAAESHGSAEESRLEEEGGFFWVQ